MAVRVAFCALLVQTQFPFADVDIRRDIAETEKTAFFLGPSKHVAAGFVEAAEFSYSDNLLAYVMRTPAGFATHLWDRSTGRSQKIAESKVKPELQFQLANNVLWMSTLPVDGSGAEILCFDARTRNLRTIPCPPETYPQVEPSMFGDGAFLRFRKVMMTPTSAGPGERSIHETTYLYQSGQMLELKLPSAEATWEFGRPAAYVYTPGSSQATVQAINLQTGMLGEVLTSKVLDFPIELPKLGISYRKVKVGDNTVTGHWLMDSGRRISGQPYRDRGTATSIPRQQNANYLKALITTDQRSARLGPKDTILAYWDRHNLLIREIKPMARAEFDKAYEENEKRILMEQAKQAAMAALIYSADADDLLPLNDGTLDRLFPYAKDPSIFDTFQYVLNGQNLREMKNPADTVLGRLPGRFGRAVVYADGHVIWDPKRQP